MPEELIHCNSITYTNIDDPNQNKSVYYPDIANISHLDILIYYID